METNQTVIDNTVEEMGNIVEKIGYRNFILALMAMDRGLPVEELEIDFSQWWESNEASFLNDVLAGERIE